MEQLVSFKALDLLYGDVSEAIYFNSTTECTPFSLHLSSNCVQETTGKPKGRKRK